MKIILLEKRLTIYTQVLLSAALLFTTDLIVAQNIALEEIIVTARKRSEGLQSTPIAITAITAEDLEARGIDQIDDIANITPNLTFQNSPGHSGSSSSAAVYIRGVGQQDFVPTVEPGVGIYVDGVYVARSLGAVLDVADVDRIEVLRGPQGTLFGRNTIGGAITFISKKPENEFSGDIEVTLGTDERRDFKGTVNVSLAQGLAARVTIAKFDQDGYVERVADGIDLGDDDTLAAKFAMSWDATDSLSFLFTYDLTRDRENGPAMTLDSIGFDSAAFNPVDANGNFDPAVIDAQIASTIADPNIPFFASGLNSLVPIDNFALLHNFVQVFALPPLGIDSGLDCLTQIPGQPFDGGGNLNNPQCYNNQYILGDNQDAGTGASESTLDLDGFSFTIDWSLSDNLDVKSITSYRKLEGTFSRDGDHSPLPVVLLQDIYEQEQITQEIQLLGTSFNQRLQWLLGFYYFTEDGSNVNDVFFPPADVRSGGEFDNESLALFAQGTFDITDQWRLTAGLRYTTEDKAFTPDQFILADRTNLDVDLDGIPDGVPAFGVGARVLPFVTETVEISELTPMVNLAYQWTEGLMVYGSYSEGFKSGGFTQRVFPPLPTVPSFEPERITVYELGFKFTGLDNRLRLNGAWFFSDYEDLQVSTFDPSGGNTAPIFRNAASAEITGVELEVTFIPASDWLLEGSMGWIDPEYTELDSRANEISIDSEFERISEWSASLGVSKDIVLAYGTLIPRIDMSYRSDYFNDALNSAEIAQSESVFLLNANIRWLSPDEHWTVTLGGTNLTNDDYVVAGLNNTTFDIREVIKHRGREWYLSAKYNF